MAKIEIDTRKIIKEITISVDTKHARESKIRIWLARKVFVLGAWIAGCGVEFKPSPKCEGKER